MRHTPCALCGKHGKTHRKANFGKGRKGKSALKPIYRRKPRELRDDN